MPHCDPLLDGPAVESGARRLRLLRIRFFVEPQPVGVTVLFRAAFRGALREPCAWRHWREAHASGIGAALGEGAEPSGSEKWCFCQAICGTGARRRATGGGTVFWRCVRMGWSVSAHVRGGGPRGSTLATSFISAPQRSQRGTGGRIVAGAGSTKPRHDNPYQPLCFDDPLWPQP